LMSWANQVNIFTAEIFGKSKPMNVSRILGARKSDIWQQLITSAAVSNILGVLSGLVLTQICLPILSSVFNLPVKSLFDFRFSINSPGTYMLFIIGFGIILTSFFHTFLLSSTNIIAYLSRQEKNNRGLLLRRSLIVFQFSIIVALTAFGLLINEQTIFMKEMPVEINLNGVEVLRSPLGFQTQSDQDEHFEYFYQEIKKLPEVESVGFSGAIPGQNLSPFEKTMFEGKDFSNRIYRNYVAADLFETYEFTFLSKSPDFVFPTKDLPYAVINESAMRMLGYVNPEKIMGKIVTEFDRKLKIVAVVKDHHQRSLHHPILPTLYDFTGKQSGGEDGFYSVRYHPNADLKTLNAKMATIYKKAFPFAAYDTFLIKDFYNQQYVWDSNFLQLIQFFVLLSIAIGVFGMIGISIIEITRRTKEITVRKILGAGIPAIWLLILKYFLLLIFLSFLVATPIAWYFMTNWLQKYTYHTEISWWIFIAAGTGAVLITLLTVSFQAIKAAIANPVQSLRTE
ncbi:MAG: FtsX-like permease family protein, partial [Chitinophagaceae bacterium]